VLSICSNTLMINIDEHVQYPHVQIHAKCTEDWNYNTWFQFHSRIFIFIQNCKYQELHAPNDKVTESDRYVKSSSKLRTLVDNHIFVVKLVLLKQLFLTYDLLILIVLIKLLNQCIYLLQHYDVPKVSDHKYDCIKDNQQNKIGKIKCKVNVKYFFRYCVHIVRLDKNLSNIIIWYY
jgi:hypothetical protein